MFFFLGRYFEKATLKNRNNMEKQANVFDMWKRKLSFTKQKDKNLFCKIMHYAAVSSIRKHL